MSFEYVLVPSHLSAEALELRLNDHGEDGYRVVAMVPESRDQDDTPVSGLYVLMEREVLRR